MNPLDQVTVSVVIPCYNAAPFLRETLESVLRQTRPAFEVLVIDDGSTDESVAIANAFPHPVRVVSQQNGGECAARNRGLEEAAGEWVAFLDADDVWEPTKLDQQVQVLSERPSLVCVHTGFYLFGAKRDIPPIPEAVSRGNYSVETLLLKTLINSSTAMVRAGLPTRFLTWAKQGGDMLYFTELCRLGTFSYISTPLVGYRMHAGQVTRKPNAWTDHFRNRFRWLQENHDCLGAERCIALERNLRRQTVDWMNIARWTRQWSRYWALREYASQLKWDEPLPAGLHEFIFPQLVYWIKDRWDALWPTNRSGRNRTAEDYSQGIR
jgi:glycosyltransferase involved in cell wall biosynthesis